MKESEKILRKYLLSKKPDFNKISLDILKIILKKTASRFGFVGYIDEKNDKLIIPTLTENVWNICKVKDKKIIFDIKDNLFGIAIKRKKFVISNDIKKDKRAKGTPKGHIKIEKFLAVPSIINGKVNGILAIANRETDYTKEDIKTLSELADIYAVIIHHLIEVKKTEEYNKMINTLIENARDMIYIINKDGIIEYINQRVKDYGYTKEDLIGKIAFNFLSRDSLDYVSDAFKKAFKTGRTLDVLRYKLKRKDGSTFDADQKSEFIYTEEGPKIIGTIRDVSKERNLEKELKQTNELLEKIFNSVTDAIYLKDREENYIKANKAFAKILNLSLDEIRNKNDSEIFGRSKAKEIYQEEKQVLNGKTVTSIKEEFINGKKIVLNSIKTPIKDSDGNIKYILGILRDITFIREMEREVTLLKARENIEKETSAFSHDLNNILSIITGYITLIEENIIRNRDMLKEIEIVKQSIKRVMKVTKRFRKDIPSKIF
jgi:PAS domain S-box-containing protein